MLLRWLTQCVKSPGNPTNTVITQDKCNVIQLPEMALLCIYFFRPQTFRVELARNRRKTVDFFVIL